MDVPRAQRAAAAISSPKALDLLSAIKDARWYLASHAAAKARVHVSTATKYLSDLYAAGVVERREVRTATGLSYEYRLPRTSITMTFDLWDAHQGASSDLVNASFALVRAAVERAEAVGATALRPRVVSLLEGLFPHGADDRGSDDWDSILRGLSAVHRKISPDQLVAALQGVRALLEGAMGSVTANRILASAFNQVDGRRRLGELPTDIVLGTEGSM